MSVKSDSLCLDKASKTISFSAPSNIAFIKYWGKKERQYPINPSLSMTLNTCLTRMSVSYRIDEINPGIKDFIFEEKNNLKFKVKIQNYLSSISDIYPLVNKLSLSLSSSNTFPHSAGIASSASAMAALACCLTQIEIEMNNLDGGHFERRASELARLASGSACRSIFPQFVCWGRDQYTKLGSNDYAETLKDISPVFLNLCDSILIVSKNVKSVSSSEGHRLMNGHSFKDARVEQAHENYRVLKNAMKIGDWECFGEILENEALTLHGLMMNSNPSYILLEPASLALIKAIRIARIESKIKMFFTIDAGPNIHLIYPKESQKEVLEFIEQKCSLLCEQVIHDEIGKGPKKY